MYYNNMYYGGFGEDCAGTRVPLSEALPADCSVFACRELSARFDLRVGTEPMARASFADAGRRFSKKNAYIRALGHLPYERRSASLETCAIFGRTEISSGRAERFARMADPRFGGSHIVK